MSEVDTDVFTTRPEALARADELECSGTHSMDNDGETYYMPCATHLQYEEASDETKGPWKKPKKNFINLNEKKYDNINFKPTPAMAAEGKRGLDWRKEFNRGGTMVGVARGQQLKNRETLSPSTVVRMYSYLRRHTVDKKGEGFSPGEKGYPSAGRIAWALWGGDPALTWATTRRNQMEREDEKKSTPEEEPTYVFDVKFNAGAFTYKAADDETNDIIIEGPVSSSSVDRDGDIVDPNAVMAAWPSYKKNPIIRFNHGREGIGVMTEVKMGEDADGNPMPIGKALIDGDEKSIVNKIKKGIYRSFSIGFRVEAKEAVKDGDVTRLKFTKIDWVETSVVDIPSNRNAIFSVVKTPSNGIFSKYLAESDQTLTYDDIMALNRTGTGNTTMSEEIILEQDEAVAAILDSQQEKIQLNKSEVDGLKAELEELRVWKAAKDELELAAQVKAAEEAKVASATAELSKAHSEELNLLRAELASAQTLADEIPSRAPERKSMIDTSAVTHSPAYPNGLTALEVVSGQQNKTPGTVLGELWLMDKLADKIKGNEY